MSPFTALGFARADARSPAGGRAARPVHVPGRHMLTQAPAGPATGERGSVAVFTVVFAIAVIFLTRPHRGRRQRDERQGAGRGHRRAGRPRRGRRHRRRPRCAHSGGRGDGPGRLRPRRPRLVGSATGRAAPAWTRSPARPWCACAAASPGHAVATVQVTVSTRPLIPGVLGTFTETAPATATARVRDHPGRSVLMAPPIPEPGKPGRRRRRIAGDVLTGLVAVVAAGRADRRRAVRR